MEIEIVTQPTLADLQEVVSYVAGNISADAFPRIATDSPYPEKKAKEWLKKYRSGKQVYSIAKLEGRVIGVAHVDVEHGRRKHTGTLAITVDRRYRNCGVATVILKYLLKACKEKGVINLRAEPTSDNLAVIKLIGNAGFKKEGKRREAFLTDDGEYLDLIEFTKVLNDDS